MTTSLSIFACSSMHGSFEGITAIITFCWVAAAILALSNLVIVATTNISMDVKRLHMAIWFGYIGLTVALMRGWLPLDLGGAIMAAFGIPMLVAAHFGYLLTVRKGRRTQHG